MRALKVWAVLFGLSATVVGGYLNGFIGIISVIFAFPVIYCLLLSTILFSQGNFFAWFPMLLATVFAFVFISGLVKILEIDVSDIWCGFPIWVTETGWDFRTQGLYLFLLTLGGTFMLTLLIEAKSEK